MAMQWRKDQPMTAAQWRLAREMHQKLCADAGISDEREEFRAWHFQNCKGALYKTMLGDNPPKRKFVEGHSIYQWLPGGENEDPELVRLLAQDDLEGFKERMRALFRDGRGREAPGTWGQADINQPATKESKRTPYVRQIAYLFLEAKKGDIVVMTSSGKYGDPDLQYKNTLYDIGVFTTDQVKWMTPEEMGAKRAASQSGASEKKGNSMEICWKDVHVNARGERVLQGDSATRPVFWCRERKLYACSEGAIGYVNSVGMTTMQPMLQLGHVLELFKKGSPIARKPAPPPPRAPRRAPLQRPQPADGARIRVGAIVKATLHAWPGELKRLGSKFRARGRVVEQGTTDELDDDCPEELRKGRVWRVHYDDDDEIFPTPESCLFFVAPPRPTPDAPAAPATPNADRAAGAPVTPEDEDEPEFIETRRSKKRARRGSTLRDLKEEGQAKALKLLGQVKKEKSAAEDARDIAQDTLNPLARTVNALQTQVDDALALALAHGADPAAVDAIRNRPRV